MKTFSAFQADSAFREQRLAFQQSNPEIRNEPPPAETPRERVGKTLKGAADALGRDPDVRTVAEKKVFELRAKQAVNSAFKRACQNRTFARENGGNKYSTVLDSDNKLLVIYNTPDGRSFTSSPIDVGGPGQRMNQAQLSQTMDGLITSPDNFSEVLGRGPNVNNE